MSWVITPELQNLEGVRWADIPANRKWTPANTTTTMWFDAADSSSITLNGSTVSQWNDKSGNNNHATQATGASQPTYTSNSVNGLPTLTFNGSNSLNSTSAINGSALNVFLVTRSGPVSAEDVLLTTRTATSSGFEIYHANSYSARLRVFPGTGDRVAGSSTFLPQATYLQSVTVNSTTSTITSAINGETIAGVGSSTMAASGALLRIGSIQGASGGGNWDGLLAEVVISTAVYSNTIYLQMEGYLAHKWGLTALLPSNHPYKNTPPVP
jgi:hypothetical protein